MREQDVRAGGGTDAEDVVRAGFDDLFDDADGGAGGVDDGEAEELESVVLAGGERGQVGFGHLQEGVAEALGRGAVGEAFEGEVEVVAGFARAEDGDLLLSGEETGFGAEAVGVIGEGLDFEFALEAEGGEDAADGDVAGVGIGLWPAGRLGGWRRRMEGGGGWKGLGG